MKTDTKDILRKILDSISNIDYVEASDIPNINLYMDQVTTFMDEGFASTKRYPEDKILTKTMINNYAKNNLLPPPVKKKYSKEHILAMIFIYYLKNILSIKDIETLLNPITEKYFHNDSSFGISDIYQEILNLEKERIPTAQKDIAKSYQKAMEQFEDIDNLSEEDLDELRTFAFICNLSFDVYIKKQLIEHLIDEMPAPQHKKQK